MIAIRTPSIDDWISSNGERCEYVRGRGIERPLHDQAHSAAHTNLAVELNFYGRRTGVGEPLMSWHHRFGPEDDTRIYVPDLVFLLGQAKQPDYADRASDLMIEIASRGEEAWLAEKVKFYLENGAKRAWVVDPHRRRIGIYSPDASPRNIEADGVLTDDLLPGFELPLASIFD
ncbi:MAG: Uma2 family endonuclease [Bryobacteraceae bacterium]